MSTASTPRRVKVYELHDENWLDKGTGHCLGVCEEVRILATPRDQNLRVYQNSKTLKKLQ